MTATPDSPDERDAKAVDLADNVTQTARVLAVKEHVVRVEIARQLRWFKRETRFLFAMAFIVILIDRVWPV